MSEKDNKMVTTWLIIVAVLIMCLVVFGGYVRLTRSGLSIVEWNPISGIIPPIGQQAWETEFAKYQETPEFQKVNATMTLEGYKEIFYLEYIHRLIARFAGLIVAIPLLYFLFKGIIPWRKSAVYVLIGLMFAFQGWLGWYMVSSGLVNNPAVSHYRLTFHLLTALLLLGLTVWMAMQHLAGFPKRVAGAAKSMPFFLALTLMVVLVLQIAYGGFMAGLKAGHVSSTYPLMFGVLVPQGMLAIIEPWWMNLISASTTVHFIHRWFAVVVLLAAVILYYMTRKRGYSHRLHQSLLLIMGLVGVQIFFGALTVWLFVATWIALVHQGTALLLFVTTLFINYRILHEVVTAVESAPSELQATAV